MRRAETVWAGRNGPLTMAGPWAMHYADGVAPAQPASMPRGFHSGALADTMAGTAVVFASTAAVGASTLGHTQYGGRPRSIVAPQATMREGALPPLHIVCEGWPEGLRIACARWPLGHPACGHPGTFARHPGPASPADANSTFGRAPTRVERASMALSSRPGPITNHLNGALGVFDARN